MYLRESILRKTAGEEQVNAALDAYRKNNPDHPQYMEDHRVEGYVNHKAKLQEIESEIANLRERQKKEGLGKIVWNLKTGDKGYAEGSVGAELMKLNKERAGNKAYIAKFENERALRRKHKFTQEALERQRSIMEKAQNASARAFVDTLPKEYQVEGATIPTEEWKKAADAAAAAGEKSISEEWGLNDRDKAAEVEKFSNYLKGGGQMSRIQIKDPKLNKMYNTIALNKALEDPEKRKQWERARAAEKSGAFGKPKILGSETLGDIGERWVYGINELNPFGIGSADVRAKHLLGPALGASSKIIPDKVMDTRLKPGAAQMQERDLGKPQWQNRMTTAQAGRDKMLRSKYQTATQNAEDRYVTERGKRVRGWLKDNWMPLAGLGIGALGILGIMGLRGNQSGGQQQAQRTPGAGQMRQPQIAEWAQNYHFRNRGPDATPSANKPAGQFNFSNVFNKFMGGTSG